MCSIDPAQHLGPEALPGGLDFSCNIFIHFQQTHLILGSQEKPL